MTSLEALQQHQRLCDELYSLALEENRFLQQHRRPAGSDLIARKRSLLASLDEALTALRSTPPGDNRSTEFKTALDHTRSRILQTLHVDRENEQLLTRYSLSKTTTTAPLGSAVPVGMLQKIDDRTGK
jgi:hypothetical protein